MELRDWSEGPRKNGDSTLRLICLLTVLAFGFAGFAYTTSATQENMLEFRLPTDSSIALLSYEVRSGEFQPPVHAPKLVLRSDGRLQATSLSGAVCERVLDYDEIASMLETVISFGVFAVDFDSLPKHPGYRGDRGQVITPATHDFSVVLVDLSVEARSPQEDAFVNRGGTISWTDERVISEESPPEWKALKNLAEHLKNIWIFESRCARQ